MKKKCFLFASLVPVWGRETNVRLINQSSNDYTDYFPDNDSEKVFVDTHSVDTYTHSWQPLCCICLAEPRSQRWQKNRSIRADDSRHLEGNMLTTMQHASVQESRNLLEPPMRFHPHHEDVCVVTPSPGPYGCPPISVNVCICAYEPMWKLLGGLLLHREWTEGGKQSGKWGWLGIIIPSSHPWNAREGLCSDAQRSVSLQPVC